jgi:hypothetical protein
MLKDKETLSLSVLLGSTLCNSQLGNSSIIPFSGGILTILLYLSHLCGKEITKGLGLLKDIIPHVESAL